MARDVVINFADQCGKISGLQWSEDFAKDFLNRRITSSCSSPFILWILEHICVSAKEKLNYFMFEKIFLHSIAPILGEFIDLVIDAVLLNHYWAQEPIWMFHLTLAFIVGPALLEAIICILLERDSVKRNWSWKRVALTFINPRMYR
jgi:hypothetical protein